MTISLNDAKSLLKSSGIASYALDAELLLAKVTGKSREQIICYPDAEISADESKKFEQLVQRRAGREPMAHILGVREFYGRDFKVTKDTLDPRPDSETLIEAALELFDKNAEIKILDFGTGTGCLLLTLLAELPNARGVAVDISAEALSVARENAQNLGLSDRTEFIQSSWAESVTGKFDLIISNPPYINSADIAGLEPEVADFEPKGALDGGVDGLDCYRLLAQDITVLSDDTSYVIFEHGIGQEGEIKGIMVSAGLEFVGCKRDLAGINRCLVLRKI